MDDEETDDEDRATDEEDLEDAEEFPIPDLGTEDDEGAEEDEQEGDEFADAGVDGNTYTSPEFGYTLEWDEDDWTVVDATTESGFDDLSLSGRRSFLGISGAEQFNGDPLLCFSTLVDIFSADSQNFTVEDFEEFEDENGDVIEGEEDDRVFGAFLATLVDEDGIEQEVVFYIECRTLVEGESVVAILQFVQPPQAYSSEAERRDAVLDTLDVPGVDEEDTDEEDEDTRGTDDRDRIRGGADNADDQADDDRDTADSRNLQAYTSRTFGYTVAWDRNVWTLTDRVIEDNRDYIEISADSGYLTFEGQNRFGGDPIACLNTAITNLQAIPGVEDWRRVNDSSLLPEGRARGDGAGAFFSFTLAPEGRTPTPTYAFVECRVLVPGESVLTIVYSGPAADYGAERDALGAVLRTVDLPGD